MTSPTKRTVDDPGAILASTVTAAAALGFVPVAVFFDLFTLLIKCGPTATASNLTHASDAQRSVEEKAKSPLCIRLTEDTMFAMASLGFVDMIDEHTFQVNAITQHINDVPSAIHGMLHFATEPLFASAFMMRKLVDTHFQYPFRENDTPTQYGYKLLHEDRYSKENIYTIMYMQGRMPSFNKFMEGKFGKFGTMPERMHNLGYDLGAVVRGNEDQIVMVDVGGGQGEMLLEVKHAFPYLKQQNLVLQEYDPDVGGGQELTVMRWDFKSGSSQPVRGAIVYSLTHIYHNLPDLEALTLMKKMADAMAPHSRMLIHEFSKNPTYGKMNATMVQLFGGRIRSSREWHQMASLCGLKVTFEAYPVIGEGLVEMRKLPQTSGYDGSSYPRDRRQILSSL